MMRAKASNKIISNKVTVIEWEDSYGASGGWQSLEGYKPGTLTCISCGFVAYSDKKVVALAPNFAASTTYTHEQGNGLMVIPKSCIRRVTSFCLSPASKQKRPRS